MRISDWSSDVCSSDLDEFSKIRLRVVLQQHGPNGAEPLRSDAAELLLRSLASLVLDAFLEPRGAAEELVVDFDGAAPQLPQLVPLRPAESQARNSGWQGQHGSCGVGLGGCCTINKKKQ